MQFSEEMVYVVYVLVAINIHGRYTMDSDQYYCDILYFNTGTWMIYDNDKILKLFVLPNKIYSE